MEFSDYFKRVKEIEGSSRSDSAKKADIQQLQGKWREEVKTKKPAIKRNNVDEVRRAVDRRIEMNQHALEQKWKD